MRINLARPGNKSTAVKKLAWTRPQSFLCLLLVPLLASLTNSVILFSWAQQLLPVTQLKPAPSPPTIRSTPLPLLSPPAPSPSQPVADSRFASPSPSPVEHSTTTTTTTTTTSAPPAFEEDPPHRRTSIDAHSSSPVDPQPSESSSLQDAQPNEPFKIPHSNSHLPPEPPISREVESSPIVHSTVIRPPEPHPSPPAEHNPSLSNNHHPSPLEPVPPQPAEQPSTPTEVNQPIATTDLHSHAPVVEHPAPVETFPNAPIEPSASETVEQSSPNPSPVGSVPTPIEHLGALVEPSPNNSDVMHSTLNGGSPNNSSTRVPVNPIVNSGPSPPETPSDINATSREDTREQESPRFVVQPKPITNFQKPPKPSVQPVPSTVTTATLEPIALSTTRSPTTFIPVPVATSTTPAPQISSQSALAPRTNNQSQQSSSLSSQQVPTSRPSPSTTSQFINVVVSSTTTTNPTTAAQSSTSAPTLAPTSTTSIPTTAVAITFPTSSTTTTTTTTTTPVPTTVETPSSQAEPRRIPDGPLSTTTPPVQFLKPRSKPKCKQSSDCQNGGMCNDGLCYCYPGFTGELCNINIDEAYGQCLNGGTCEIFPGGHRCNCKEGFKGDKCQEISDYCKARQPCVTGVCKNVNSARGLYQCECPSSHIGKRCERKRDCMNECHYHHAQCVNNVTCACLPGRREERTMCEYIANCEQVEGDLCLNGGTCRSLEGGGYHCLCQESFYGPICQFVSEKPQFDIFLMIVVTCVGFLIATCAVVSTFIFMSVRKARATRGAYSPSTQEKFGNAASDLLKPPQPERLI